MRSNQWSQVSPYRILVNSTCFAQIVQKVELFENEPGCYRITFKQAPLPVTNPFLLRWNEEVERREREENELEQELQLRERLSGV